MKNHKSFAIFLALLLAAGCASTNKTPDQAARPTQSSVPPESRIDGNIPANAPFAKIKIGMSQGQVHSILGQPTDTKMYQTGKMWIPFYFGNDMMRTEEYYKGVGRITFTGVGVGGMNLKVFSSVYDPTEDGFQDVK